MVYILRIHTFLIRKHKLIKIVFILSTLFCFTKSSYAYDKYPYDYDSFKCLIPFYHIELEYNISNCDYQNNSCIIDNGSEGTKHKAYSKMWDKGRLTIFFSWKDYPPRILTIYPDYGEADGMPVSVTILDRNEPVEIKNNETGESNVIGGASSPFAGLCMPLK